MKKAEVYNISAGQYQSSSRLLGKSSNMQNIYCCKIINGSYMALETLTVIIVIIIIIIIMMIMIMIMIIIICMLGSARILRKVLSV